MATKDKNFIVYVLTSLRAPSKHYVGFTKDLEKRIKAHNARKSRFSQKYAPWKLESCVMFVDEAKAKNFEKYLKKGSGHAFLKKHFI